MPAGDVLHKPKHDVMSVVVAGVLDVAGGRGEVAFNLHTLRGIPCTLIDPRPQKLTKQQYSHLQALAEDQSRDGPETVWIAGVVMLCAAAVQSCMKGLGTNRVLLVWTGPEPGICPHSCNPAIQRALDRYDERSL